MEEPIRAFIALLINDELRNKIKQIQDKLRLFNFNKKNPLLSNVKWTDPEKIHLTLKFLGDIKISQIDDIGASISDIRNDFAPFAISFSSVGAFPNVYHPRIIWIGIDEGREIVCELSQQIEDRLAALGFEKEKRKFHPHLTIGRIKEQKGAIDGAKIFAAIETSVERMTISAIHLMKSQLTPQGAIYSVLKEAPLMH